MPITNGKFRKKKVNFAQVSNVALRDENLSLKAKGLYSIIQSYITIEDFDIYKNTLFKVCKEGEKAFDSAWQELKKAGYLKQYRIRVMNEEVNGFVYEYELLDEPNLEQPALTSIGLDGREILKNEQSIVSPQNGGGTKTKSENCTTPKTEGVQNVGCTKEGVSNNTDLNNTYSLSLEEDKQNYGRFKKVQLLQQEYDDLLQLFGQSLTDSYIDDLDSYKESSGKEYKSDYATLLKWIKRDNDKKPKTKTTKQQQCKFHNFIQHEYEKGELDAFADKKREEIYNRIKNKDKPSI